MSERSSTPPYRIDFVLIVLTGNLTRYLTTRPLVDADPTVRARWYPVRTWVQDDWLGFLPGGARLRVRHLLDSRKFFIRRPAEAVVMHALDTYSLYGVWHRILRSGTVIINNPDGIDYARKTGVSRWLLTNALARTDHFVPWSNATADALVAVYPAASERMSVLHPGLPLEQWPLRDSPPRFERFRLLFVGGDAMRKGLDTLLDAFESSLSDECELDVVTQTAFLPVHVRTRIDSLANVRLHLDLQPGSAELKQLFGSAGAFVLPTRQDVSSWVALESMATGVPVIIAGSGGIPDIVVDNETGLLIPAENPEAIAQAVEALRTSPALIDRLVAQGRAHVEANFDAAVNAGRLTELVKELVNRGRH